MSEIVGKKIKALPEATTAADTDVMVIEDGSKTRKIGFGVLRRLLGIDTINNNLLAGYVSKNVAAGATVEHAVSFTSHKPNKQYAVTLDQCSDGGTYTGITLSVKSKNADGFVIRIASSRSDTITLGVNWICIPYSA